MESTGSRAHAATRAGDPFAQKVICVRIAPSDGIMSGVLLLEAEASRYCALIEQEELRCLADHRPDRSAG